MIQLELLTDFAFGERLSENLAIAFRMEDWNSPFEVNQKLAIEFLGRSNVNARPSSDVFRPTLNGVQLMGRDSFGWTVDFPPALSKARACEYDGPYEHFRQLLRPGNRDEWRSFDETDWWRCNRPSQEARDRIEGLARYVATPMVSKHRVFVWAARAKLPAAGLVIFARQDDYFFGVLQSHAHAVWSAHCGRETDGGGDYGPAKCFETFPFPFSGELKPKMTAMLMIEELAKESKPLPTDLTRIRSFWKSESHLVWRVTAPELDPIHAAVEAAARELNQAREDWLNPTDLVQEEVLEFRITLGGVWSRHFDERTIDVEQRTAMAKYPQWKPKDRASEKELKKRTLTNLYDKRPVWLDEAHKKLDHAVAAAYGWPADLSDPEILERLLKLNLERAAQEKKPQK